MASRTFILLALAFAVVLLITSEVAAANSDNAEINDSGHGGHNKGGGGVAYGSVGGRKGGHTKKGGKSYDAGGRGCRHGCCGGGSYKVKKGCKCCSSFEEAIAYKQTQN